MKRMEFIRKSLLGISVPFLKIPETELTWSIIVETLEERKPIIVDRVAELKSYFSGKDIRVIAEPFILAYVFNEDYQNFVLQTTFTNTFIISSFEDIRKQNINVIYSIEKQPDNSLRIIGVKNYTTDMQSNNGHISSVYPSKNEEEYSKMLDYKLRFNK